MFWQMQGALGYAWLSPKPCSRGGWGRGWALWTRPKFSCPRRARKSLVEACGGKEEDTRSKQRADEHRHPSASAAPSP